MPSLKELIFGRNASSKQLPTKTPGQMSGLDQLLQLLEQAGGQGGGYGAANNYYNNLLQGGPEAFSQFEAPYRQEFEQYTIPGIAERFAGQNAMGGGLMSSGFGQALGGAGAQLQAQLAGLHANLRNNAAQQQYGQYNQLANQGIGAQTFGYQHNAPSNGLFGDVLGGIGSGFGMGAGYGVLQKLAQLLG